MVHIGPLLLWHKSQIMAPIDRFYAMLDTRNAGLDRRGFVAVGVPAIRFNRIAGDLGVGALQLYLSLRRSQPVAVRSDDARVFDRRF